MSGNPYIDLIIGELGITGSNVVAEESDVKSLSGILPSSYVELFAKVSQNILFDGLIKFVKPSAYNYIFDDLLSKIDELNLTNSYALIKSAFGVYKFYSPEDNLLVTLSLPEASIILKSIKDEGELLKDLLFTLNEDYFDMANDNEDSLYKSAIAKHGRLGSNEIFAFQPLLPMGGSKSSDNLVKASEEVHLEVVKSFLDFGIFRM